MDATWLMLSMLFGAIGTGYIIFARNAGRLLPAIAGVGLLVLPYFFESPWTMTLVCGALTVAPWVWREF